MINLMQLIGHKNIYDLFSYCVYKPSEDKIERVISDYQDTASRHLYGLVKELIY